MADTINLGAALARKASTGDMSGVLDQMVSLLRQQITAELREELAEARRPQVPQVNVNVPPSRPGPAPVVNVAAPSAPNVTVEPQIDVSVPGADMTKTNALLEQVSGQLAQLLRVLSAPVEKRVVRGGQGQIDSVTERRMI